MVSHRLELIDRFVADLGAVRTQQDILTPLRRTVEELGFGYVTYEMTVAPSGPTQTHFVTTFPKAYIERYIERRYADEDFGPSYARRVNGPFLWESGHPRDPSRKQRALIDDTAQAGLKSGGIIPLHGPVGVQAYLSIAGNMGANEFAGLFGSARHELILLAHYAHACSLRLDAQATVLRTTPLPTQRELEVLTWTARGKTRRDIAAILQISDETVKDHLERACARLGAVNKTHAVARALKADLITP